jgi:hypothetical protein
MAFLIILGYVRHLDLGNLKITYRLGNSKLIEDRRMLWAFFFASKLE